MLLFIVNVGHAEVKITKSQTLAYFTIAQYDKFSDAEEKKKTKKKQN